MAAKDKENAEVDVDKLVADMIVLKAQNEQLAAQVAKLNERPSTKAERREAREKALAEKKALMAKRDALAKDTVVIQKFNRDGDLTRERTCAKVDVESFRIQGYSVAK